MARRPGKPIKGSCRVCGAKLHRGGAVSGLCGACARKDPGIVAKRVATWRKRYGKAAPKPKRDRSAESRRRYLPIQLEATRRKLLLLEREAARLGLTHLLEEKTWSTS